MSGALGFEGPGLATSSLDSSVLVLPAELVRLALPLLEVMVGLAPEFSVFSSSPVSLFEAFLGLAEARLSTALGSGLFSDDDGKLG